MKGTWKNGPWRMSEVKRLVSLKREGKTFEQIAAILGRPRQMVGHYWQRYGDGASRPQLEDYAERIRALAAQGLSCSAIGEALGLARQTGINWCRRLGLDIPDGRALYQRQEEARRRNGQAILERCRVKCEALGWPEVTQPIQALILCHLSCRPMTARELHRAGAARDRRGLDRHLRRMRALGFVERSRVGGVSQYRLAPWLRARHIE